MRAVDNLAGMKTPKDGAPAVDLSASKKTSSEGAAVRRVREALGWSQDELARRAGISRPTIARIESGATDWLTPGTLESIASAVGLTADEIRGGHPQFADPLEAVDAYLKSPFAQIDQPDDPELQWLRGLPPYVWAGQGKPDPRAVSKILEFHRLGKKRQ